MNPNSTFLKSTWDRIDAICDRFESDRRHGRLQPLTSYLADEIEGAERDLLVCELLALEYELFPETEESVVLARFVSTLPDDDAYRVQAAHDRIQSRRSQRAKSEVPAKAQIAPGNQLGPYTIVDLIGSGGMGQVYKARHAAMGREVALKVLSSNLVDSPEALRRFRREIRAAAQLDHPNVVSAFDAGEDKGVHFLVMQFVDGRDLASFVKSKGPLSVSQAARCVVHAAKGLDYAHRQGIVHRDIKPHNLMADRAGVIRVLDLGLARFESNSNDPAQSELTGQGTFLGTVDYMAPEQTVDTRTADRRADIYSLGCTLYFLLTGHAVYDGDTIMKRILAHRESPIPRLFDSDGTGASPLEPVFRRMVAKAPDDRYQSMSDVIAAIRSCLDQPSGSDGYVESAVIPYPDPAHRSSGSQATQTIEFVDTLISPARSATWRTIFQGRHRRIRFLALLAVVLVVIGAVLAVRDFTSGDSPVGRVASSSARKVPSHDDHSQGSDSGEIKKAIQNLVAAAPDSVVAAIDNLKQFDMSLVRPELLESYVAYNDNSDERRNISLALLPVDDSQIEYLSRRILKANSAEFQLLTQVLKDRSETVVPLLWDACRSETSSSGEKLRGFAAQAEFDAENELWAQCGNIVLESLVQENNETAFWLDRLKPVTGHLRPFLVQAFSDDDSDRRRLATTWLLSEPDHNIPLLTSLVPKLVDSSQFAALETTLRKFGAEATLHLEKHLSVDAEQVLDKDILLSRLRVAGMLLQLEQSDTLFRLLSDPAEAHFRSGFAQHLPNIAPGARTSDLLAKAQRPLVRTVLLKSLGLHQEDLTDAERNSAIESAKSSFMAAREVAEHSMAEWFLRRAGEVQWLAATTTKLSTEGITADRNWYVSKSRLTMAIFDDPDGDNQAGDRFAISTHEVPVSLFNQFREAHPDFRTESIDRMSPLVRNQLVAAMRINVNATWPAETVTDHIRAMEEKSLERPEQGVELSNYALESPQPADLPVTRINWFEAAAMCRWISEIEGLAEMDNCFPQLDRFDPAEIGVTAERFGNVNNYNVIEHIVVKLRTDPLKRTGYRLPTTREWNLALTATRAYQQIDTEQNSVKSPSDAAAAIGSMPPNDRGLFEMPGNVREWCLESPAEDGALPVRFGDQRAVADRSWRASTRKGQMVNSTGPQYASFRAHDLGFRIARTLPDEPSEQN